MRFADVADDATALPAKHEKVGVHDDKEYAKTFGLLRHSLQEGFFGSQLTNRLRVLDKRWIRRKAEAELDIAILLSILHAGKLAARRARLGTPRAGQVRSPCLH